MKKVYQDEPIDYTNYLNKKKMRKFEKAYRCMGLSLKDGYRQVWGSVGDVHSLGRWLELIYPHKTKEELLDYFADDSTAEILNYIRSTSTLRLIP